MASKAVKSGLKRCKELLIENKFSQALTEVENVLLLDGDNYNAKMFRGKILVEQKKFQEAENDFRSCVDAEPDKALGYQGLSTVYLNLKWWELLIGINRKLIGLLDQEKRLDLVKKTLDAARVNEYFQEWCDVILDVETQINKQAQIDLIETQWDTIPFQILHSNQFESHLQLDSDPKKIVFNIWLGGSLITPEILSDEQSAIRQFETGGNIDLISVLNVEHKSYPSYELFQLLEASANGSLSPKERIVNARVLFQKYEKFDFILSMKNFRGCDVDKNFAFSFNSKNCQTGIQFFLLEQIFFFADIQDLILADEILASQSKNKEFDLFRAKKALIDDDINELKSILSNIDPNPNVSIILRETEIGKGHMTSYTERLQLLECELAVIENEFDKAEKMIGNLSENAQVLSMKGRIYESKNDTKSALKNYLKSAKLNPNSWHIFYLLGKSYLSINDRDRGVKCLKKSISLCSRTENIELVCQYVSPGEALSILHEFKSTIPNHEDIPLWFEFRFGLCLLEIGNSAEAIRQFQRLTRRNPDNAVYWECLAESYVERGSLNTALKSYQRAAELSENDLDQLMRIKYRIGQLHLEMQEHSEAQEIFNSQGQNRTQEFIIGLAEANLEVAQNYALDWLPELSYQHIEKVLQLCLEAFQMGFNNQSPMIWKLISDSLMITRHFEKELILNVPLELTNNKKSKLDRKECLEFAISGYLKIVSECPSPFSWSDLAIAYFATDNFDKAVICGKKSVELLQNETHSKAVQSEIWHNLGVCALKTDPSVSQHALIESLELNSENGQAWTTLGILYLKHGNEQKAHQALSYAQAADPENSNAWAGLAHIAEFMDDNEVTDLFRHSSELINISSANAHSFHIAKNCHNSKSNWYERNIRETNGLATAATNILRLTNVKKLTDRESEVAALLSEKTGLNQTALKFWMDTNSDSLIIDPRKMKLNAARVHAKLGNIDEAIEILGDFENSPDADVNKTIGRILSSAGYHDESYQRYETAHQLNENDFEITYSLGLAALKAQELDVAKTCLVTCVTDGPDEIQKMAMSALIGIALATEDLNYCEYVLKLLDRLKGSSKDSMTLEYFRLLEFELKVRMALLEDNVDKAIRMCTNRIHLFPSEIKPRKLLAKILLRHDQNNPALPNLLPPNLSLSDGELFSYAQLTASGAKAQRKAANRIAKQYHLQPWNHKMRSIFATSLDLEMSSMKMTLPNEENRHEEISKLRNVQEKYFMDLFANQSPDQNRAFNLSSLARLSADVESDAAKLCLELLEDIDNDYHMPILAKDTKY